MSMLWNKIEEKLIHDGYRKIIKKIFSMPDGRTKDFEIKLEGNPVCVVALTCDEEVILAKQYRPGPEKVLFELPGGGIEDGESPIEAIRRELLEETGYVGDVEYVSSAYRDGYSTGIRHCFIARNCRKIADQQLDDSEFIEVVTMSLSDFRNHLRSGELSDVEVGYLGLDYLNLL